MNTGILFEQLFVAIIASTITVPLVQRFKGFFPNAKILELFSIVASLILGFAVARYYAGYDMIASAWVGFFSLIGAEAIYTALKEKLKKHSDTSTPELDLTWEAQHLLGGSDE